MSHVTFVDKKKSKLLSFADVHINGGFEWTGFDLADALAVATADPEFAGKMGYVPLTAPITPQSRFNFGEAENYVKRVALEELGVLAQIAGTQISKHGQNAWVMKGVCPFHRRVHRNQHWVICEGRKGMETFARCMKPLKRFTATCHYPTKTLGDLALEMPILEGNHRDRTY
jgi:hypothetical protein